MDAIDIAIMVGLAALVLVLGLRATPQNPGKRAASPKKPVLTLPPTKGFPREVAGEGDHQDVLAGICGGFSDDGHELDCEAVLRADPANPKAVRVEILGKLVGHLIDAEAARFLKELAARGHAGEPVVTKAKITGGWRTGAYDQGSFEVRLGFGWPLKLPKAKTAA
jgi:hypothetical protein